MTKREVVQFWRVWCRQNRIDKNVRMQGAVVIEADHKYWESQKMSTLYEALQIENSISPTRH